MNHALLAYIIKKKGFTKDKMASLLGLSRQGFYNKLGGVKEFKASEIKKLALILKLTNSQKNLIFFSDSVGADVNGS